MGLEYDELAGELSFLKDYSVDACFPYNGDLSGYIILRVYLDYLKSNSNYYYAWQFLKTKYIELGINDDTNWDVVRNGDISYLKNDNITRFLTKFGQLLLPPNQLITKMVLEQLSRDLNIKFFISVGSSIQESWSFKFINPVPISFHLKSKNPPIIDYILHRSGEVINSPSPNLTKNLQVFTDILQTLENLIKNLPLSKETKNWASQMQYKYAQDSKQWKILTSIQKAPSQINLNKELQTANKSFSELDSYHRPPVTQSSLVSKFGGVEIIDYNKKITEIIESKITPVSIPESSEESKIKSDSPSKVVANEEVKREPKNEVKALPSAKFHCDQCRNNPLESEINSIECGCTLSQDCLSLSLSDRKCTNCSKPISNEAFERMIIFFG